jgi:hypothetical protein
MRTFDPAVPNRLANLPEVAAKLCPGGEEMNFDFSDAIADPRNIFLFEDQCCAICIWSAPRVYECHIMKFPGAGVRSSIAAFKRMRDFMMKDHADMLWGQPAIANKAGRWLIRQIGFKHAGFGSHPMIGEVAYVCHR